MLIWMLFVATCITLAWPLIITMQNMHACAPCLDDRSRALSLNFSTWTLSAYRTISRWQINVPHLGVLDVPLVLLDAHLWGLDGFQRTKQPTFVKDNIYSHTSSAIFIYVDNLMCLSDADISKYVSTPQCARISSVNMLTVCFVCLYWRVSHLV